MANTPFLVDTHETPTTKGAFTDVGLAYTLADLNNSGFGDFYWTSDDAVYSVEHKSASNLVRNFAGRPTLQLVRQFQEDVNNILMIQGVCHPGKDGLCHIYRLSERQGYYHIRPSDGYTKVNFARWTGWKMAVMLSGITIIEALNSRDMAYRMKSLYNQSGKDVHTLTGHTATIREESWQMNVLLQIPKIGCQRARQLLDCYGTLDGVFGASPVGWPIRTPSYNEFMSFVKATENAV